jgi:hypothetical protein
MADPGTAEQIFDIALQIQLRERKYLEVDFLSPDQVRVLLPPKRMLTATGALPLSKITTILSEMERDHLIQAEQRGGTWTTPSGNRIIARLLTGKYREEAEKTLGPVVLEALQQRLIATKGDF